MGLLGVGSSVPGVGRSCLRGRLHHLRSAHWCYRGQVQQEGCGDDMLRRAYLCHGDDRGSHELLAAGDSTHAHGRWGVLLHPGLQQHDIGPVSRVHPCLGPRSLQLGHLPRLRSILRCGELCDGS
ncbi:hypothetical protein E2C01_058139 [Portunus trituberculatus]|uniref:Uncharacterized protein n=1 Tax=Portunus trituberculatus TaxID=210409 RepID=A0A5B7H267_PORTR|nr:hypothetical protein [Portunus trituberculatus]